MKQNKLGRILLVCASFAGVSAYAQSTADLGYFFAGAATNGGADGLARSQHTIMTAITGYFDLALPKIARKN